MSKQRTKDIDVDLAQPPQVVVDRLAGLLPADALQDALEGLAPDEITGPGGLLTQLAGRVIDTVTSSPRAGSSTASAPSGSGARRGFGCPRRLRSAAGSAPRPPRREATRRPAPQPRLGARLPVRRDNRRPQFKLLNIVDEFTREALAMECERSIDADETVATLDRLVAERGIAPANIRCDNGPELTARVLAEWCDERSTATAYIEPGSPWQNPYAESFNSRVRDEHLDTSPRRSANPCSARAASACPSPLLLFHASVFSSSFLLLFSLTLLPCARSLSS